MSDPRKFIKPFDAVLRYMRKEYTPETELDEKVSKLVVYLLKKELVFLKS